MEAADENADSAWASVDLAVAPQTVSALLDDPILLLRLNPCLEFRCLERLPDGGLKFDAHNESNACRLETDVRVLRDPGGAELTLLYSRGIKRATRLRLEPVPAGTRLSITESYATPDAQDAAHGLAAVDRSLVPWTAALRRHLERSARHGWIPGYRWWSTRFWPSMTPGQRRVTWLITWTTAVEFLVFLAVLAVYVSTGM
ncbi:MAG: hypothetical protein HZA62_01430 [Rhodocyclales bacterium]|nr:hypothetical protein [Rhodocyclales bacterium]